MQTYLEALLCVILPGCLHNRRLNRPLLLLLLRRPRTDIRRLLSSPIHRIGLFSLAQRHVFATVEILWTATSDYYIV